VSIEPLGYTCWVVDVGTGESHYFIVEGVFVETYAAFAIIFIDEVFGGYGNNWELADYSWICWWCGSSWLLCWLLCLLCLLCLLWLLCLLLELLCECFKWVPRVVSVVSVVSVITSVVITCTSVVGTSTSSTSTSIRITSVVITSTSISITGVIRVVSITGIGGSRSGLARLSWTTIVLEHVGEKVLHPPFLQC